MSHLVGAQPLRLEADDYRDAPVDTDLAIATDARYTIAFNLSIHARTHGQTKDQFRDQFRACDARATHDLTPVSKQRRMEASSTPLVRDAATSPVASAISRISPNLDVRPEPPVSVQEARLALARTSAAAQAASRPPRHSDMLERRASLAMNLSWYVVLLNCVAPETAP